MVLTGAYHGHAHVIDLTRRVNTTLSVNFKDKRGKSCGYPRLYKKGNKRLLGTVPPTELPQYLNQGGVASSSANSSLSGAAGAKDVVMSDMSSKRKGSANNAPINMTPSGNLQMRISMGAWHPKDNTFAVAKHNSLFIYTEKRSVTTSDKKM